MRQHFSFVRGTSYADVMFRGAAPHLQQAAVKFTSSELPVPLTASTVSAVMTASPSLSLPATLVAPAKPQILSQPHLLLGQWQKGLVPRDRTFEEKFSLARMCVLCLPRGHGHIWPVGTAGAFGVATPEKTNLTLQGLKRALLFNTLPFVDTAPHYHGDGNTNN